MIQKFPGAPDALVCGMLRGVVRTVDGGAIRCAFAGADEPTGRISAVAGGHGVGAVSGRDGGTQNDPVKSAQEAVTNMRLRAGKVAVLDGGKALAASGPFDAVAASRQMSAGAKESAYSIPGARAAVDRFNFNGRAYVAVAVEPLDAIEADLAAIRRAMFLAFPLILAIAGAGGYWFATRGMAPLDAMAAQARRITGSNLDARLQIGGAAEELTALAESFNELLGRLDQSFENMRRFVADASHELRTPVAVIRGEADVTLAKERSAAEYKESLAIILDESRRLSLAGGRSAEPGAGRCGARQAAGAGVLLERSAIGMLPVGAVTRTDARN